MVVHLRATGAAAVAAAVVAENFPYCCLQHFTTVQVSIEKLDLESTERHSGLMKPGRPDPRREDLLESDCQRWSATQRSSIGAS